MESKEKAILIGRLADESKAENIIILDVSGVCNFTDLFVIATCGSSVQLRSLGRKIERTLRDEGVHALGAAGYDTTTWALVDFGDVVVHLFDADAREHYRLDKLWRDGKKVDWAIPA